MDKGQFLRKTPFLVKMFDWIKSFLWALEINPTNEPGVEGLKPYSTPSQFGFPYFQKFYLKDPEKVIKT